MIKNEQLTKTELLYRASLRGIKKCTSCGHINGQRALICRNVNCDLRIRRLASIKPFDPIQLTTNGYMKLFSLRSKEKLLQPRNFVSITESQDSINSHSSAVCYVDNCKYNSTEPTHLVCRHIKACNVLTNVAVAEVYPIDSSVLWNLNIPVEQKQHLWELYQKEKTLIQPVQKLNSSIFVVKCEETNMFPAGRLHVTISNNKTPSKTGNFSCSCKKLKIIMEPDNSVTMKQEVCDHVLLLLAAILSKPESKKIYRQFLNLLQHLWMPVVDFGFKPTEFLNNNSPLGKCFITNINDKSNAVPVDSDDIFNFSEELFAENNIPDFYDLVLDTNNDKATNVRKLENTNRSEKYKKDPKFNAIAGNLKDEEMDLSFQPFNSPGSLTCLLDESALQMPPHFNENNLSVIEQFQLNPNNIHISNDNIDLAKDIETLNNMESNIIETNSEISCCLTKQNPLLKTYSISNSKIQEPTTNSSIGMSCMKSPTLEPTQKSTVLNQGPIKVIQIPNPLEKLPVIQCPKIVQIIKISPKKVTFFKCKQKDEIAQQNIMESSVKELLQHPLNHIGDQPVNLNTSPSLTYESWLDHVIEVLNESVVIKDSSSIQSTFHVPETFFNYFSKTFISSNGAKLPNKTTIVKNEKYKSHTKYSWSFNRASTVQRIFTSKNVKIELERLYKRLPNNIYELFIPTKINLTDNISFKTIYPKIHLYKAFIKISNGPDLCSNNLSHDNCSFRLDWLPSAFPKSNFGLMTIEFCVSVKELDGKI